MGKKDEKIQAVYDYICSFVNENGYSPSIREICDELSIKSTSSVQSYIIQLCNNGLLRKRDNHRRSLMLQSKCGSVSVPVVGKVTAGEPILAVENLEGYYPLPLEFGSDVFMLNVEGESMIEAGIMNGDKIIVKQQDTADNGDIVVAFFDENATVKRFYKRDGYYILHPENHTMQDIVVDNVSILGKVIGLVRKF